MLFGHWSRGPWRAAQTKPQQTSTSMVLDTPTLAFMAGCLSLMQLVGFAFFWVLNRGIPGLAWWTLCSVFTVSALVFMLLRQFIDATVVTKVLATIFAWSGALCFLKGAASFRETAVRLSLPVLFCIPCFAGYLWFGWKAEENWLRPIFYSIPMTLFLGWGSRELLREKRAGLQFSARFIAVATLIYVAAFTIRAIVIVSRKSNPEPLLGSPPQILAFSSTLLWLIFWAFGTMLLVNQWRNREAMRYQEAQLKAAEELAQATLQLAATERELAAERTERQRTLLQRDLHDGLGGVTANLVLLASIGRGKETSRERQELMQHIEHLAVECNREVRMLMNVLHGGSLSWQQFLQEFREYVQHLAAGHRFALNWMVSGTIPTEAGTDLAAQISLMRCLKEAVNNLARHAHASSAVISIRFFPNHFGIRIRDNGRGMPPPKEHTSRGNGLRNMIRRCEEMNGRITFLSSSGTVLRFVIPLPVSIAAVAKKPPIRNLAVNGALSHSANYDPSRRGGR
jgi:signal transduction histidine kinase